MNDVIIRKCKTSDAEKIACLNTKEMGYDYSVSKTLKNIEKISKDKSSVIFVAVCNDEIVGYIHAESYQLIYCDEMKNIMGIAVDSSYKRKGIGTMLLNSVEEWADESGCKLIRLNSGESRVGAHDFYRKCGYGSEKQQLKFTKKL